jgi:hypothetical protein
MIKSVRLETPGAEELARGERATLIFDYGNYNMIVVQLNRTPAVQTRGGIQFGDQFIKMTPEGVDVTTPGMAFFGTWNNKAVFAQLQNALNSATVFNSRNSSSGLPRANAVRAGRKKTRKTKKTFTY